MNRKTLIIAISIFIYLISIDVSAQQIIPTEREILSELEKRGLEKDEVYEALIAKGIDVTDLVNLSPEDFLIIEDVILQMEKNINVVNENTDNDKSSEGFLNDAENEGIAESDSSKIQEIIEVDKIPELPPVEMYGQEIFRKDLIRVFQEGTDYKAPDSYILGVGDELNISIWGKSQLDQKQTVNKDGYIRIINGSKRVFLKGQSLGAAKEKLAKVLRSYYSFNEGEFDVNLNFSRSIRIDIYGEVINPGPVTIPAINSPFSALAAVSGPNNLGSLRNIQLIKSDNTKKIVDVYKYMADPAYNDQITLDDGDIILVPVSEKVVTIEGAIQRPTKYELLDSEGLVDLIEYAGGPRNDAYLKNIRIQRYENDKKIIADVNYRQLLETKTNFKLFNGDVIFIDTISTSVINFVEVQGEVETPGVFERSNGMRVSDVIAQAGLKSGSRTDIAFVRHENADGTKSFEKISIDDIINNRGSEQDLILSDKDVITIWAKERFVDEANIKIDGAVRYPDEFPYDVSKKVRINEAIILAGGLRRDASNFASIHRKDPLNPKIVEYITLTNLDEVLDNPNSEENILLNPFDSIYFYSENTFLESSWVTIYGAVNSPGTFQYGKNMELKDLMVLSGGFKLSAATNNVEISRVLIENNKNTNVVVDKLVINRDLSIDGYPDGYPLQPFDKVSVRYVPEFELQESVVLNGEVQFPGSYSIIDENEKISSIINRAGGLTDEAFPEGASLYRAEDDLGAIVIKLNDDKFDFIVRGGDTINIPKSRQFVTIKGATNAKEVLSGESINAGNEIHVPYHKGKSARYYINHYAGGFNKNANRRSLVVKHPNGEVKRIQRYGFFQKYPEVNEGSIISIAYKTSEENDNESEERLNWTEILSDSVGQAMSILTLLLLVSRLD